MGYSFAASASAIAAIAFLTAVTMDPVVVYLLLASVAISLHPEWRLLLNAASLGGALIVSGSHDPFVGDAASFVRGVAAGADASLSALIHVSALLVLFPVAKRALVFDFRGAFGAPWAATGTLAVLGGKYVVESQIRGGSIVNAAIAGVSSAFG